MAIWAISRILVRFEQIERQRIRFFSLSPVVLFFIFFFFLNSKKKTTKTSSSSATQIEPNRTKPIKLKTKWNVMKKYREKEKNYNKKKKKIAAEDQKQQEN